MGDNAANRDRIVEQLRAELFGPDPAGTELDVSGDLQFEDYVAARGPFRQLGSGEEILTRDSPTKRYGVGVLFPPQTVMVDAVEQEGEGEGASLAGDTTEGQDGGAEQPSDRPLAVTEAESDDFDLGLANAYQPSTIGVSFLADFPVGASLVVKATGGRYVSKAVAIGQPAVQGGQETQRQRRAQTWWLRQLVRLTATFSADTLLTNSNRPVRRVTRSTGASDPGTTWEGDDLGDLRLAVEVLSRPVPGEPRQRLLTVCLVNRSPGGRKRGVSDRCLLQSRFTALVRGETDDANILPYPTVERAADAEEQGLALLYRDARTFATGHGCAADWESVPGRGRATAVTAECLPVALIRDMTPDIVREDGSALVVPMAPLAGLVPSDDGVAALREVVDRYEAWIQDKRATISGLESQAMRDAANDHMQQCERAAARMRDGLAYLRDNPRARRAFQLANHAILLQQIMTSGPMRQAVYDAAEGRVTFPDAPRAPDPLSPPPNRGTWRAFQIAFLLASIRSTAEADAADRRAVELIWFPTGGGKTEAYLGLAAFAAFKRRLDDPSDAGVHVLMRYTLRLLTAQQFQRASALLCAMEYLRRTQGDDLGEAPFSAGIWLGGDTTPNTRDEALKAYARLSGTGKADNPFLLSQCPWCRAQFGRIEGVGTETRRSGRGRRDGSPRPAVLGYRPAGDTVQFACADPSCFFRDGLPILVVDQDIYRARPTLVIGTIDKFAMLAWRDRARALFGIGDDGKRFASPPGLIIQDELHLIAGPLGSLAGLYETLVEELCTDRRGATPIPPKIVSSTATIRRYREQIGALYARQDAILFPPPGLEASDSFFARRDERSAGRVFVGVHAPSLGSVQTEWVRTYAAIIQAPMLLLDDERDPWWTTLAFFNSLREMGTAHTLLQSDIPDYFRVIWERKGTPADPPGQRRYLNEVFELTGGLQSEDIAQAIARLSVKRGDANGYPVDICLASNIIEVGIDIPRLALMVVAGQPKTTAQYLQVTGRVGRAADRPGLIVTMYSPSKPRDRSHFERFRSYHNRLYAQVEPTSVTPFSPPALDRALHAALVGYVRQAGPLQEVWRPTPFPQVLVDRFKSVVLGRAEIVDKAEKPTVEAMLAKRVDDWRRWQRSVWERQGEEIGLLRAAGDYAPPLAQERSWATPTSMRNVDAGCEAEITLRYEAAATEEQNA